MCKVDLEYCGSCPCEDREPKLVPRTVTCASICSQLEDASPSIMAECEACCGCCSSNDAEVKCSAFGYSELVGCLRRNVFDRSVFTGGVMAHCPGESPNEGLPSI